MKNRVMKHKEGIPIRVLDNGEVERIPYQRPCERCGEISHCEEIPMMGYSEFLCRKCAAAAYRNEEAI